jgi:hypothetical protein
MRGFQCARTAQCACKSRLRQTENFEEQVQVQPSSALAVLAAALADENGALPNLLVKRGQAEPAGKPTSYVASAALGYGSYVTMPVPEDDVLDKSGTDVLATVSAGRGGGGFGAGASSPRQFGSGTPRGKDKLDENEDEDELESTDFGATVETEDPTDALGGDDDARLWAERTRQAVMGKLHRVSVRQRKLQEAVAAK